MSAATETRNELVVSMGRMVSLFVALGFKSADKWDRVEMSQKLAKLPAIVKDADVSDMPDEDSSSLDDLLNTQDGGGSVTITDEEEEEEEEVAEEEEEEEVAEEKPAPKAKAVKAAATKAAPTPKAAPKIGDEKPSPKAVKAAKEAGHLNRPQTAAITAVAKKSTTLPELIKAADEAFVKVGGNSNTEQATWSVKISLQILTALKAVTVTGEKIVRNVEFPK